MAKESEKRTHVKVEELSRKTAEIVDENEELYKKIQDLELQLREVPRPISFPNSPSVDSAKIGPDAKKQHLLESSITISKLQKDISILMKQNMQLNQVVQQQDQDLLYMKCRCKKLDYLIELIEKEKVNVKEIYNRDLF
jgi:hypothetical protein